MADEEEEEEEEEELLVALEDAEQATVTGAPRRLLASKKARAVR